jgi:hypothetical protein
MIVGAMGRQKQVLLAGKVMSTRLRSRLLVCWWEHSCLFHADVEHVMKRTQIEKTGSPDFSPD